MNMACFYIGNPPRFVNNRFAGLHEGEIFLPVGIGEVVIEEVVVGCTEDFIGGDTDHGDQWRVHCGEAAFLVLGKKEYVGEDVKEGCQLARVFYCTKVIRVPEAAHG